MSEPAGLEDVGLVLAIEETGSIGAAASVLHVSQPSASQRLAVLERRVGALLVERDTTGARLTPAGELFAEHGRRAVELLDRAVDAARSPVARRLAIGAIAGLAPVVFPALQAALGDLVVEPTTDHGRFLARHVADGTLDAAFISVTPAESPAPGVRRTLVGRDRMVLVGPQPMPTGGRRPLAGLSVAFSTYDHQHEVAAARLARLGAVPVRAASTVTAAVMARQSDSLACVPHTTAVALGLAHSGSPRIGIDQPIWLVSKGPRASALVERLADLRRAMGLRSLSK